LKNVTRDTIEWYDTAFNALCRSLKNDPSLLAKAPLRTFVVTMRHRNMKPVSVNTYVKALECVLPLGARRRSSRQSFGTAAVEG
jgi:hypothetical protein